MCLLDDLNVGWLETVVLNSVYICQWLRFGTDGIYNKPGHVRKLYLCVDVCWLLVRFYVASHSVIHTVFIDPTHYAHYNQTVAAVDWHLMDYIFVWAILIFGRPYLEYRYINFLSFVARILTRGPGCSKANADLGTTAQNDFYRIYLKVLVYPTST